ncbi:MAG TPA: type IV pilin protein [Gammaproteobacteria bacterium]|nr:type IV pilin protein [Gammaproteobacteria bacterium]
MKPKGFTLLELMIVVAIIGILAAIAWPRYQQYVIETNRTDGKRELLQTAQELERCYTLYNAYNDANCTINTTMKTTTGIPSKDGFYIVTGVSDATTYTLTAAPQGIQTQDAECGSLTLTQAGVRGESGTGTAQDCW